MLTRPTEQTLSMVCSQWRRIALRTPEIWSLIPPSCSSSKQSTMISAYIERSRDRPVDLYLNLSSEISSAPLLFLLTRHSLRWRSISVCCNSLDSQNIFTSTGLVPILSQTTRLEHFSLLTLEELDPDDADRLHVTVLKTPRVLSPKPISISALRLQDQGSMLFPYSIDRVTTLHVEQYLKDQIRPVPYLGELSSSLVNLSIHGCFEFNPAGSLSMPQLVSLRYCGGRELGGLLSCLHAPLLESFVLKNLRDNHIREFLDRVSDLTAWNDYKFPALYHLTLDHTTLSKRTMSRLFIEFNSVTQFDYINSEAEDVLGLLSGDGMEAELPLPYLETLSIHYFRLDSGTEPHIALSHLLTSRTLKANRPLTKLRVHSNVPLPAKFWSVELMRWSELCPWPREREYPDLHDPFMALSQPPLPVMIQNDWIPILAGSKRKKDKTSRKIYDWR
ncbi:hypothetical protein V5O48_000187 [Marasmius crinis-equi]|uniref:F-box domain-containing protein n=1 Tax=Marasmius crinis-equi TaxID=585013 RepID=A0ABR3G2X5_9AGAR